jgi:hypothetical protein
MAIWYVDPINGNNANNGSSFALRKQTYDSLSSVAAGDTVRTIASPDPTSMAQNATWTYGSQTVTLTTAVTADITQATTAWTASTNVTATTSTNRKIGTNSSSIAVAAAFTTGKAAYLTISSTNFSSYQQVSFWINMTAGTMAADGDITLRLCSDTTGDVTVNTISVPRIRATGQWQAYTVDLGTNLGSAIQSIALYVATDNGAQTFLLNNILACKASSSADSLSLVSLISKNSGTDPWLGIQSISGTTVTLGFNPQYSLSVTTQVKYAGSTATQTIYKRETLNLPSSLVASTATGTTPLGQFSTAGTAGSRITISGGWNRTDMSTQTGDTYISGVNGFGYGIFIYNYQDWDKINLTKFNICVNNGGISAPTTASTFTAKDISGNNVNIGISGAAGNSPVSQLSTFTVDNCQGAVTYGIQFNTSPPGAANTSGVNITVTNLNSNYISGFKTYQVTNTVNANNYTILGLNRSVFNITNCNFNGNVNTSGTISTTIGAIFCNLINCNINITNMQDNGWMSLYAEQCIGCNFNISGTVTSTSITQGYPSIMQFVTCYDSICNLTGATITAATNKNCIINGFSNMLFRGGTYSVSGTGVPIYSMGGTSIIDNSSLTSSSFGGYNNVRFMNYGGSTTDQRTYISPSSSTILTDTTTRHTASGVSWKMTITSLTPQTNGINSISPLSLPVATIACNASALVTASVWVYRTDTNLTTTFICPGGQIAGVSSDVTTNAAAAINTWEQLTITFTPSQQGVVQLFVQCYGAAASVYVDDFSVSQA